jgi:hypothetical protein
MRYTHGRTDGDKPRVKHGKVRERESNRVVACGAIMTRRSVLRRSFVYAVARRGQGAGKKTPRSIWYREQGDCGLHAIMRSREVWWE